MLFLYEIAVESVAPRLLCFVFCCEKKMIQKIPKKTGKYSKYCHALVIATIANHHPITLVQSTGRDERCLAQENIFDTPPLTGGAHCSKRSTLLKTVFRKWVTKAERSGLYLVLRSSLSCMTSVYSLIDFVVTVLSLSASAFICFVLLFRR